MMSIHVGLLDGINRCINFEIEIFFIELSERLMSQHNWGPIEDPHDSSEYRGGRCVFRTAVDVVERYLNKI